MKQSFLIKKLLVVLLSIALIFVFAINAFAESSPTSSVNSQQGSFISYTYWQEFGTDSKTAVPCKPMYKVKHVISGADLGLAPFTNIDDVFASEDNNIYILDGEASIIYILDSSYKLTGSITAVKGDKDYTFNGSKGLFAKIFKLFKK